MALREYRRKRDFRRTSEPDGDEAAGKASAARATTIASGHRFVVQKHAARRLHYDFRLELDGVLKSWAVPKGPSLDPAVKSLAVEVEDHPLDYAGFEGVIPKGQYGGGTVMVWDRGDWTPRGDVDPATALKKGKLDFELHGEKLSGGWTLVRMKDGSGDGKANWLLIKRTDAAARPVAEYDLLETRSESVLTGRDLDAIAADADRVWTAKGEQPADGEPRSKVPRRKKPATAKPAKAKRAGNGRAVRALDAEAPKGAKKAPFPREFAPQLATAVTEVPDGDEWLHELKYDGYRIVALRNGGGVRLLTRKGNDWTAKFQSVAEAVRAMPVETAVFDGELVALDEHGISDFQRLQNHLKHGRPTGLVYYVFDLPYHDGFDLRPTPLVERKEGLARILLAANPANDGIVRYGDHIRGDGPRVLRESCRHGLEGVVSKKSDAPYENRRSRCWVKSKCRGRQEFVIGGFTRPQGTRKHFGALLVGVREGKRWMYCGRVGTGFSQETLRDLAARMRELARPASPFDNPPGGSATRGVTWIEPKLVAEVEFGNWTDEGLLRHPAFLGLREEKAADEIVREPGPAVASTSDDAAERRGDTARRPAASRRSAPSSRSESMSNTIAGITLTNPDRVLYPEAGFTKRMLATYYEAIADHVLPHVVERPLTIVRCPKGHGGQCFYQKHWTEGLPDAVDSVPIREKEGKQPYVVVHDLAGIVSLVQMSVLEFHPWPARTDNLDRPDRIVLDLDPGEGVEWDEVKRSAVEIRDLLDEGGLVSFVRASGGKGLHVVVPLTRRNTWDEVADFTGNIATGLAKQYPKRYVANMRKDLRKGRIFLDHLRNRRGATAIATYSTRARAGAPVAAPLSWAELDELPSPTHWNVANVPERLAALDADPWPDFETLRQSITRKARDRVEKMTS